MLRAIMIWIILVTYIIFLCRFFSKQMLIDSCYTRAHKSAIYMQNTYEFRKNLVEDIDPILGLQMMIVALKSGAAITRALDAVGAAFPCAKGDWLKRVSKALICGDTWREAWSAPYVCFDGKDKSSSSSLVLSKWLKHSLQESFNYGCSPVPVLRAVLQNYEQSMKSVAKKESSKLSVKLLLPVGLCFLPAFIFVGILPTVASFMH